MQSQEIKTAIIRMEEQIKYIAKAMEDGRVAIDDLSEQVNRLQANANRWQGGLLVLVALGGIFGALMRAAKQFL